MMRCGRVSRIKTILVVFNFCFKKLHHVTLSNDKTYLCGHVFNGGKPWCCHTLFRGGKIYFCLQTGVNVGNWAVIPIAGCLLTLKNTFNLKTVTR